MNERASFSIRNIGNIPILDLYGKIIGSRALIIKDELNRLRESGISNVILNFEEVSSIDSLGVMAITASIKEGLTAKIINLGTECRGILEQNHTANLIPIFGTEDEAIGNTVNDSSSFNEKRKHSRFTANIPVEILFNNIEQRGVLLNISEEGALVGYLDPLGVDTNSIKSINIMMKLPFLGSLELDGTPVRFGRNSDMNTIGIQLLSIDKSRKLMDQVYKKPTNSSDLTPYNYGFENPV